MLKNTFWPADREVHNTASVKRTSWTDFICSERWESVLEFYKVYFVCNKGKISIQQDTRCRCAKHKQFNKSNIELVQEMA